MRAAMAAVRIRRIRADILGAECRMRAIPATILMRRLETDPPEADRKAGEDPVTGLNILKIKTGSHP